MSLVYKLLEVVPTRDRVGKAFSVVNREEGRRGSEGEMFDMDNLPRVVGR